MRRLLTWFGLIALLATAPALADVTVRYKVKDQESKAITLAVAGNGNARFDSGDGTAVVVRDGTAYFIASDRQGPMVGRVEDGIALITEFAVAMMQVMEAAQAQARQAEAAQGQASPPPTQGGLAQLRAAATAPYDVQQRGRETVGGREGIVYVIAPAAGGQGPTLEIVLSTDSDLAPVGGEVRRLVGLAAVPAAALLGESPDLLRELDGLLARGVPIRIGQHFTLAAVSAETIPASAFELPGPVLTREALRARMAILGPPGDGPVRIAPMPDGEAEADADDE